MAAEAIPSLSFEAQHPEEYIDYSEDDAVTANGPNHSSFSANAQFSAGASGGTERSLETMDAQDAVEPVGVSSDAQLEGNEQDHIGTNNDESAIPINEATQEPKSAIFNENEISWEDNNNNNGPVENSGAGHLYSEKSDWQLVDEETNAAENADFSESLVDEEQQTYYEGEETSVASVGGNADATDINIQENAVPDVDSSFEEQANDVQDLEADGDLHEIDYFEDGNAPADASAEDIEAQPESYDLDQENASHAHTDEGVEDRNTVEVPDPASQNETENGVAIDVGDDVDTQNIDDLANDGQEYAATGDDTSVHEHMDYEDEVIANMQSPESIDTPSNEDMDIPVITVSYKGVEYPFFYNSPDSAGKECFFDDLSLLHCKMEGVLAGFRRELANELGPFDELVFQIDELGLEFAESTQPDEISDITLGQVISVFDSLVKNQDPEASKPLYALLVTRPNCKKRWLSLVDDAYNGKGLDEVSYYFASQAHSEADEPDIMDDLTGMIGEEDNADATAWPNSPGESARDDQEDGQGQEQDQLEEDKFNKDADVGASNAEEDEDATQVHDPAGDDTLNQEVIVTDDLDAETTMVDTDFSLMDESTAVADIDLVGNSMIDLMEDQEPQTSDRNGKSGSSLVTPCFYPQPCICNLCVSPFTTERVVEDSNVAYASPIQMTREDARHNRQTLLGFPHLDGPVDVISHSRFHHSHSAALDSSMGFSLITNADNSIQVTEIEASHSFASGDTEEADLHNAVEDDQHWPDGEDDTAAVGQITEGTNEGSADKVTPNNTSATSTLSGDDTTYEHNELDLNIDMPENEGTGTNTGVDNDELAEIDWREFPGQGDNEVSESPLVAGKRPRSVADDLLEEEAEKDVKRRRP
ncbi:conserved glutamic acid-rich protein [Colletotrichum truncatum]|uniref:Conserved glutamic acid-rich protein n=1 Tax=Colletotrichum truncatum TaxID=5467 RepID=A0ACC3YJ01_COLTU